MSGEKQEARSFPLSSPCLASSGKFVADSLSLSLSHCLFPWVVSFQAIISFFFFFFPLPLVQVVATTLESFELRAGSGLKNFLPGIKDTKMRGEPRLARNSLPSILFNFNLRIKRDSGSDEECKGPSKYGGLLRITKELMFDFVSLISRFCSIENLRVFNHFADHNE